MTNKDIIHAVNTLCELGATITLGPVDILNSRCGYQAKITLPAPNVEGFNQFHGDCGMGQNPVIALINALDKALNT